MKSLSVLPRSSVEAVSPDKSVFDLKRSAEDSYGLLPFQKLFLHDVFVQCAHDGTSTQPLCLLRGCVMGINLEEPA